MIDIVRIRGRTFNFTVVLVALAVLALAFLLGRRASMLWLGLLLGGGAALVLLARPVLGLPALVLASLAVPLDLSTGTDVNLNAASLLVPGLAVLWLADRARRRSVAVAPSRTNLPLLLFLAAGLLSLLIGRATWDPTIPVKDSFILVQLAQWAIFAFSALAFWLPANLAANERWLRRLTAVFLLVGGGLAVLRMLPGVGGVVERFTTIAFIRAPFWALLAGLAGGQLLFNRRLAPGWRAGLLLALAASVYYAFVQGQETASNWVGLAVVLAVLTWLRFRQLRWPLLALAAALALLGLLFPAVYDFAGGDEEWETSGASRLALIERVTRVTMRNPITGLGPAGYRPYANATPLRYLGAYWTDPKISSHNNYVDLFAHGGVLGLLLFGWFAWEVARLGIGLRRRFRDGFAAGYVNGMLATGAASLAIMMLADWILPFVYNVGFPGFQASVLVWLFMGGLVALEDPSGQNARGVQQESAARVQAPEVGPWGGVGSSASTGSAPPSAGGRGPE